MRDFVISGLAYLLSMNTDIGLKHFLTLGYDSNSARRTIFCKVISRVMDLGGRLETQSDSIVAGRRVRIGEVRHILRLDKTRLFETDASHIVG